MLDDLEQEYKKAMAKELEESRLEQERHRREAEARAAAAAKLKPKTSPTYLTAVEDDKDESLALVPYVPPEHLQVQEIDNEATRKYRRERLKREARKKEAQLKKGLEDKQKEELEK